MKTRYSKTKWPDGKKRGQHSIDATVVEGGWQ